MRRVDLFSSKIFFWINFSGQFVTFSPLFQLAIRPGPAPRRAPRNPKNARLFPLIFLLQKYHKNKKKIQLSLIVLVITSIIAVVPQKCIQKTVPTRRKSPRKFRGFSVEILRFFGVRTVFFFFFYVGRGNFWENSRASVRQRTRKSVKYRIWKIGCITINYTTYTYYYIRKSRYNLCVSLYSVWYKL